MFSSNLRLSQGIALISHQNVQAALAAPSSSIWVSMERFQKLMAAIAAGALGGNNYVVSAEQAKDAAGTDAKAITAKVSAAQAVDNEQVFVDIDQQDLDMENDFDHVRITITPSAALDINSVDIWAVNADYQPAGQYNLSSVAEIV